MKTQENLAEKKFREWLDTHQIPFWHIRQDMESFSHALQRYMTKRPDFMILVPHVGFILVDVKDKKPAKKYKQFQFNEEETKQHCNLQNFFNLQVWYVLSNEDCHYDTWYWIPASKVLETGHLYHSKIKNEEYRSVSMKRLIQVSMSDNLGRLFSEMPKFL